MGKQLIDLTGQHFGRLTVIKQAPAVKVESAFSTTYRTMWQCKCDCGKEVTVWAENLKRGITKSCGCFRREMASQRLRAAYDALAIVNEMEEKSERII